MAITKIEWTEATWNPCTGCTKISAGCANCYAERMTRRLTAMGVPKYRNGFKLACHPAELNIPYTWKNSKMVFVNSMSDLFHDEIPFDFIKRVFEVMNDCPQHIFQILTKRSENLLKYAFALNWTPNIWMGVTVENEHNKHRINDLIKTPAHLKFLSLEPLLSPLDNLNLMDIDWVIVGGESGPGSRPIKEEWVIDIKTQCENQDIPFFFKQWGGINKKAKGNLLLGKKYMQMPNFNLTY